MIPSVFSYIGILIPIWIGMNVDIGGNNFDSVILLSKVAVKGALKYMWHEDF